MHGTKVVRVHVQHVKRCMDTCAACEKMYSTALPGQTLALALANSYTTRCACIFYTVRHTWFILSCCAMATLSWSSVFEHNLLEADVYQLTLTMCLSCIPAWYTRLVQFYELLRVEIWSIRLVEEITLSQYYLQYVDTSKCVRICVVWFLTWLPTFY